jgi:hypothetical protein
LKWIEEPKHLECHKYFENLGKNTLNDQIVGRWKKIMKECMIKFVPVFNVKDVQILDAKGPFSPNFKTLQHSRGKGP